MAAATATMKSSTAIRAYVSVLSWVVWTGPYWVLIWAFTSPVPGVSAAATTTASIAAQNTTKDHRRGPFRATIAGRSDSETGFDAAFDYVILSWGQQGPGCDARASPRPVLRRRVGGGQRP